MPQDYQDASYSNNTGLNGQVTPTVYTSPGVLTTVNSPFDIAIPTTAQLTTRVNPGVPSYGINSIVQGEQQLVVAGQIYQSAGGILNKAQGGGITTGGGP